MSLRNGEISFDQSPSSNYVQRLRSLLLTNASSTSCNVLVQLFKGDARWVIKIHELINSNCNSQRLILNHLWRDMNLTFNSNKRFPCGRKSGGTIQHDTASNVAGYGLGRDNGISNFTAYATTISEA